MSALTAGQVDALWEDLAAAIDTILNNVEQGFPLTRALELYTVVYNYCTVLRQDLIPKGAHGAILLGEELYTRLRSTLSNHLVRIFRELSSQRDESLLQAYLAEWNRFSKGMQLINHIFNYLNRFWVKRKLEEGAQNIYEIRQLSLVLWRSDVFMQLRLRIRAAILAAIAADRVQGMTDHTLLNGVVASVVVLGLNDTHLYKEELEKPILDATQQYYTQQASVWASTTSPAEYATMVQTCLDMEQERVRLFLHRDTEPELLQRCEQVLIAQHIDHLSADFVTAMETDQMEDIHRMYSLLARVKNGLDGLRATFEARMKAVGTEAIAAVAASACEDPALYCNTLLRVLQRFSKVVTECFKSDAGFVAVLHKAARTFVNTNAVTAMAGALKSPELVARQVDQMLRATNTADAATETGMDGIMTLFRLLDDKDVFQKFYARRLAARLIGGLSASEDAEAAMLSKLKEVCGYEYTSKLQRMFTDMTINRDINKKLQDFVSGHPSANLPFDFSVLVLATGSWPLDNLTTDTALPADLERALTTFATFYKKYYTGRKLNWLLHLSRGEMTFVPRPRVRFVLTSVNAFQISVLLAFNSDTQLTMSRLTDFTRLSAPVLRACVQSLVRTKILIATGDLNADNCVVQVNSEFKSKRTRFAVAPMSLEQRSGTTEEQPVAEEIQEDRKLQIQAAIVRIMKARKSLEHNQLMAEVMQQLQVRFKPSVPAIKKAVEQLIDKEYLERSTEDKSVYVYKA